MSRSPAPDMTPVRWYPPLSSRNRVLLSVEIGPLKDLRRLLKQSVLGSTPISTSVSDTVKERSSSLTATT